MQSVPPFALVEKQKAILHIDGTVTATFYSVNAGSSYFIRVQHRNALKTWSKLPVLITDNTTYDFSAANSKAFGNNQVDVGTPLGQAPKWAFYSGDISDASLGIRLQDNVIESQDYLDMENSVSLIKIGYNVEDVTGDGVVESLDYPIMENNVGQIVFTIRP